MFTLQVHRHPDVTVVRCSGRIVRGDYADTLRHVVMSQEQKHIQIDLSHVEVIDAGGLGTLVALEQWALGANRTIEFLNPTGLVREAIEATKLTSVLQIDAVMQAFGDAA